MVVDNVREGLTPGPASWLVIPLPPPSIPGKPSSMDRSVTKKRPKTRRSVG